MARSEDRPTPAESEKLRDDSRVKTVIRNNLLPSPEDKPERE
jgi:hypothetical protein